MHVCVGGGTQLRKGEGGRRAPRAKITNLAFPAPARTQVACLLSPSTLYTPPHTHPTPSHSPPHI